MIVTGVGERAAIAFSEPRRPIPAIKAMPRDTDRNNCGSAVIDEAALGYFSEGAGSVAVVEKALLSRVHDKQIEITVVVVVAPGAARRIRDVQRHWTVGNPGKYRKIPAARKLSVVLIDQFRCRLSISAFSGLPLNGRKAEIFQRKREFFLTTITRISTNAFRKFGNECPGGTNENSPAIHRWVFVRK